MNKNIITIVLAILFGVFAGWFIFGNSPEENQEHKHQETAKNQMWTCSMHPQIMQPEPGDCPICGMDLIPATSGSDGLQPDEFKLTKNAMALANIQTTVVGNSNSTSNNTISLSGKIVDNEETNAVQSSYFTGRIETLNINSTGEQVKKGQLLALIYSPELYAAQQELITAASLKSTQPQLYNAVKNKLKLWKLSDAQINQIESSGKVRDKFPVYATVSGIVTQKLVAEGDYVKQGEPILKIADLSSVWASFDVYENQIQQFKEGQNIEITTNAIPNKTFEAQVDFINPILNTSTRTVKLRAVLNNKEDLFKPGMFVKGLVKTDAKKTEEVIQIPATAVMWTGERSLVYVQTNPDEPIFKMRDVVLGNRVGDRYEIISGLENQDIIVTNGTFTVDAAAQLQGKKSMMNSPEKMSSEQMTMDVSEAFQSLLKTNLSNYYALKEAFVASNSSEIHKKAQALNESFSTKNVKGLSSKEQTHLKVILEFIKNIELAKTLADQRSQFVGLNETLVSVYKQISEISDSIFIQKCPMANNNKGAIWLSHSKVIENPYFGEEMLSCGEVIYVIN